MAVLSAEVLMKDGSCKYKAMDATIAEEPFANYLNRNQVEKELFTTDSSDSE